MLNNISTIELKDPQDKGKRLIRLIETDLMDRRGKISKIRAVRDFYHGSQDRILDYEGQPDIHLNVITEKVETVVPKFTNAFWGAVPIVHVLRVAEEFDSSLTKLNEIFMNWAIESDIEDLYQTTECWFRNVPIDGTSVIMSWWDREDRITTLVQPIKTTLKAGQPDMNGQIYEEDQPKTADDILVELFGLPQDANSDGILNIIAVDPELDSGKETGLDNFAVRIDFIEDRRLYENVLVEFHASEFVDEINVYIHRPIIVRNAPRCEIVEFEDLIVPYRTQDLQTTPRVTRQYWLTYEQILDKVKNDAWDITEEELEQIKATMTGQRIEQHDQNSTLANQKDAQIGEQDSGQNVAINNKGLGKSYTPEPFIDNRILIFEMFCRDNVSDEGTSEVIYQIPYCLEKVVRSEYLEERFPHGRRPFSALHCTKLSGWWYGVSWGELLLPINVEVNSIVNMVNEAQELINNPWGVYVPHANTVDPEIIENIEPGQLIPVGDINGIAFPTFPQQPLANLQEIDTLLLYADKLTMAPQAGGSSQVRNNPRTARAQLALLSEASMKTDMMITNFQRGGWRELIHQIHALYMHFGPDEKFFYVTGQEQPERITQEQMRGRYEYKFSGNTINTNREAQRIMFMQLYQAVIGDPLMAQDLDARQQLIDALFKFFGEGLNLKVPQLPGRGADMRMPLDQMSEIRMMQQGIPVQVIPADDDAAHLNVIMRFMQSPEIENWESWATALLAAHAVEHRNQMVVKQSRGAVEPGSTANNVPTQMGDLEGGVQ